MNYRKKYMKIISKARKESRRKNCGIYYEEQHILPQAIFPLWKNRKSNKILLTGREHFEAHKLLAKIYGGKMINAIHRMAFGCHKNKYNITAEEYEEIRIIWAQRAREMNTGKKHSNEAKIKSGRYWKGRKRNIESVKKSADARRGVLRTEQQIVNISKGTSEGMKKVPYEKLAYWKGKSSPGMANMTGKCWYNNGQIEIASFNCPDGFIKGRLSGKKRKTKKT